ARRGTEAFVTAPRGGAALGSGALTAPLGSGAFTAPVGSRALAAPVGSGALTAPLGWAALAALLLAGCVDPDPPRDEPIEEEVAELAIDPDARLALEPGEGIVVGLEYASGGTWTLTTVCDTARTGARCVFDIIVDSFGDNGIGDVARVELDREDRVIRLDPYALNLDLSTGSDVDSVSFATDPGASLRVSVALFDPVSARGAWAVDPRLVSWI